MTVITSYSHQNYNYRTSSLIDAANYYCADEIGAKMKSRKAIWKYLGLDYKNVKEATC